MNIKIVCIISGIVLLLAIPSGWPSDFYIVLRWFVFISAIIIVWNFYNSKLTSWTFIFGAIAFLFNPIIPVYLNKSSWISIDFISAILYFLAAFSTKNKNNE